MKRTLALAIAVVLSTPFLSLAQRPDGAILQSAERAALGMELQADDTGGGRSRGRTRAGIVMIVAGAALTTSIKRTETCIRRVCTRETTWLKEAGYSGIGLAAAGVLLATVWSDAPANRHVDFAVAPDRIQVGKTIGF